MPASASSVLFTYLYMIFLTGEVERSSLQHARRTQHELGLWRLQPVLGSEAAPMPGQGNVEENPDPSVG